jgi:Kdo2-lipid IVA lauroyltransferase/acyltransferase
LILYGIAELGRIVVSRLPTVVSYSIASTVGDMVYYCWPRGRRNMLKCVASVLYSDVQAKKVKTTARHGMRNFCKYIVDMLRYANSQKSALEKDISASGLENIDKALQEGKGVILVSLHMGNLDLGARFLSNSGYPINAITNSLASGQLNRFLEKPRVGSGLKLINPEKGVLHMLDVLRRNEVIALMIDSPHTEKGVMVNLGQKLVLMPSGVAAMALRTGAKIIPCGLVRTGNTKFHAYIGNPVQIQTRGDLVEDAKELTQSTMKALEKMASSFADQWYIFHPLIKDENLIGSSLPAEAKTAHLVN